MAVGITAGVTVAVSIFACQTRWDFTGALNIHQTVNCIPLSGWGVFVFISFIVLVIMGFIMIFVRDRIAHVVYASIGALLFSFYIVYDTQVSSAKMSGVLHVGMSGILHVEIPRIPCGNVGHTMWECPPYHVGMSTVATPAAYLDLLLPKQRIVGGKHRKFQYSIDDYVFASLTLYMDIINLFLFILGIISTSIQ